MLKSISFVLIIISCLLFLTFAYLYNTLKFEYKISGVNFNDFKFNNFIFGKTKISITTNIKASQQSYLPLNIRNVVIQVLYNNRIIAESKPFNFNIRRTFETNIESNVYVGSKNLKDLGEIFNKVSNGDDLPLTINISFRLFGIPISKKGIKYTV
jgi:hypothetical protein